MFNEHSIVIQGVSLITYFEVHIHHNDNRMNACRAGFGAAGISPHIADRVLQQLLARHCRSPQSSAPYINGNCNGNGYSSCAQSSTWDLNDVTAFLKGSPVQQKDKKDVAGADISSEET